MTLRDATLKVLASAAQPPTAKGVWDGIVAQGLEVPHGGKTPDATVGACLYTESRTGGGRVRAVDGKPRRFILAKVVREFGGKQPMHYREIAAKALENGRLQTQGAHPSRTPSGLAAPAHTCAFLSAHRGIFGSGHFQTANRYLASHGLEPIRWTL